MKNIKKEQTTYPLPLRDTSSNQRASELSETVCPVLRKEFQDDERVLEIQVRGEKESIHAGSKKDPSPVPVIFAKLKNSHSLSRKGRGQKAAFTLAEVLITLGVIGVVAALTVPSLVSSYKEKQRIAQLKKTYTVISQAFQMVTVEYGNITQWGLKDTNTGLVDENGDAILDHSGPKLVTERLKKYIKQVPNKKVHKFKAHKSLDGRSYNVDASSTITNVNGNIIYLADGTIVAIGWVYENCGVSCDIGAGMGDVQVFLPESISQTGVSNFWFYLTPGGIKPYGNPSHNRPFKDYCDIKNTKGVASSAQGRGCTAWVLINENMDYLRCPEKLSWDGKHKCSE